jgi:hypothetical protein
MTTGYEAGGHYFICDTKEEGDQCSCIITFFPSLYYHEIAKTTRLFFQTVMC